MEGFGHKFQTWNNCGPATLAMTLSYFDLLLTQDQTAAVLKPNPEDRNVSPYEMVDYVENETPFEATDRANGDMDTVRRLVANGIPVILEIGIEPPGEYRWLGWYGHYLLVVAYDDAQEHFWVYDSWFGTSEEPLTNAHSSGRILPYSVAEEFWPHFNRHYIAVYLPEQAELVAAIIGPDMDDDVMWENALTAVRAEIASSSENAFLWFNLGTIYNELGEYEQAATAFDKARSIGLPWRMLWYQFGPYEAYYQVGRYEDVILLADVTLKDRPYFEESYYYRGLALEAQGDRNEARNNYEKAVEFNPNFVPAAAALVRLGN
jgi:tetratricopeptide (TPR) repeat protein